MNKKICLTGIQPTGHPHLGNYIGAMKPAIQLSGTTDSECYYFIADYHALIGVHDAKTLQENNYQVAASWIACGLDTSKATLYLQSQIPEVFELQWILTCFTPKGLMNRAHAYKAKIQLNNAEKRDQDFDVNMGLFSYPILMAADILFLGAHTVPIGSDQVQHVEIARDIASHFNFKYGDILTLPEFKLNTNSTPIPGLDGRKMSKSYNNHIPIFIEEKKLRKMIMKIKTDSKAPEEPKEPKGIIFDLYSKFSNEEEIDQLKKLYSNGISWGDAKQLLFEKINAEVSPMREKYQELIENPALIDRVLLEGTEIVRLKARKLLDEIRAAVGVKLKQR